MDAERDEYRKAGWHAWRVAQFTRVKTMPSLKSWMKMLGAKVVQQQTPEEMLKIIELINKSMGGKDLRKKEESN